MSTSGPINTWDGHQSVVLVIEHEAFFRGFAKRCLEEFGFRVLTAGSADEGLEQFRKLSDDIAVTVLDLQLPDERSGPLFAELRSIRPDACIIVSGTLEMLGAPDPARKAARDFLMKPYIPAVLIEKIFQAMRAS